MRLVAIESPYAGDHARNTAYVRACLADSLKRGEAPYASHALYTQLGVLDDTVPAERHQGISAGLEWASKAELRAVYTDLGISEGMQAGIEHAARMSQRIEFRTLGGVWGDP